MKPTSPSRAGGRESPRTPTQADSKNKQTPNTDMQAEDAGTAESGDKGVERRGTAAETAMKQTSKTKAERGSHR